MPEVDLVFPRAFLEFVDPADADQVYKCDLTWLTSSWTCIFGTGCPGVYTSAPDVGCCAHGAHFADDADHQRVAAAVGRLSEESWEKYAVGVDAWTETDDEGELKTRTVDGACIFHRTPDEL